MVIKQWFGRGYERFTHHDMNRVNSNAKELFAFFAPSGVPNLRTNYTRADQFDYQDFQALELAIKAMGGYIGQIFAVEEAWGYNRTVSWVDFERVEAYLYMIYVNRGGTNPRQTVPDWMFFTLYAKKWEGTGPYHQILDAETAEEYTAVAFCDPLATVQAFADHINAVLKVVNPPDERISIVAYGIKPTEDIPIIIKKGVFKMQARVNLPASAWVGSGPWTQSVSVAGLSVNSIGIVGAGQQQTVDQFLAFRDASMRLSAVGTNTATVQVVGDKPTIDISIVVAWEG